MKRIDSVYYEDQASELPFIVEREARHSIAEALELLNRATEQLEFIVASERVNERNKKDLSKAITSLEKISKRINKGGLKNVRN